MNGAHEWREWREQSSLSYSFRNEAHSLTYAFTHSLLRVDEDTSLSVKVGCGVGEVSILHIGHSVSE